MARDDADGNGFDEEPFDDESFDDEPHLDEHETTLVQRDLEDLADFESTFRPEGYRGVAVFCHDCVEDHYYEWDMLRENLQLLIDSGETPVHEPAFAPEPDRYVPWEYARGYVDALRDAGVGQRLDIKACPRCGLELPGEIQQANFCPRCGAQLVRERIAQVLEKDLGLPEEEVTRLLAMIGLPTRGMRPPDGG